MRSNIRRLVSNHVIDRRSENVIVEEGDRRTWELAGQLAQIDSSSPGTYESQIEQQIYEWPIKEIEEKAGALKNRIELIQKEVMPGRFNLMARILGREEAAVPSLVHTYHMDVVILGEGWEEGAPALGVVVKEDRLYGRGIYDTKSGLACALSTFPDTAELAGSTGELPVRPFVLIETMDEENSMWGVERAIRGGWVGREDWVLDTEPTNRQIQAAHKDRTWFKLTTQGVTAHASNPRKGADAIAAMAETVCYTRKTMGSCPIHGDLGIPTVTPGQIAGGYRPYVVPDSCKVWIDMRLMPSTDTVVVKNIVEEVIKAAEAEIVGIRGSYTVTGDRPYTEEDSGSRLLVSLKSVCDRVTEENTYIGSFNGYMDTTAIMGTLDDRNCMSYSSGSLELAHKPNEHVPYENVCQYRRVLAGPARQEAFFPFIF